MVVVGRKNIADEVGRDNFGDKIRKVRNLAKLGPRGFLTTVHPNRRADCPMVAEALFYSGC